MINFIVNKAVIIQKIDNKITIVDTDKSTLYSFNETASYIFSKIKLKWEESRIVSALVRRYAVSALRAKKDLNNLITDLLAKKIITRKRKK